MAMGDRRREKFAEFVNAGLTGGEKLEASLPWAQTGPTPMIAMLTNLYVFFVKYRGVAVTDKQVIVVALSKLSGRAKQIASSAPRTSCSVTEWDEGKLFSKLRLSIGGQELKLNVHRVHRSDAAAVVAAMGAGA